MWNLFAPSNGFVSGYTGCCGFKARSIFHSGYEIVGSCMISDGYVYLCPQEKILAYSCYNKKGQKKRYLAAKKDCSNCPCRQQCIGSSKNSRMVERMLHEEAWQEQAKNRNTPEYFSALRLRKIWCEGNFSHQKAEHNLRRTYKRGIERVTEQCLLSACAMNLIRLVKAANAVFFRCLGVIFQRLFRFGGICQQRRNTPPFQSAMVAKLPGGSVSLYDIMSDSGEEKCKRLQKSFPKPLWLIDLDISHSVPTVPPHR